MSNSTCSCPMKRCYTVHRRWWERVPPNSRADRNSSTHSCQRFWHHLRHIVCPYTACRLFVLHTSCVYHTEPAQWPVTALEGLCHYAPHSSDLTRKDCAREGRTVIIRVKESRLTVAKAKTVRRLGNYFWRDQLLKIAAINKII